METVSLPVGSEKFQYFNEQISKGNTFKGKIAEELKNLF